MNGKTRIEENKKRDKIYACWMGKSIGGTLGAPVEGCKELMNLTFYTVLGEQGALPNDDLDLQLIDLHALEQHGVYTDAEAIAAEWTEHVRFPWDEYGYAGSTMRYGLKPPLSGCYDNPFTDCMGSPIRSEIWAVVACGDPALASYFAWQDAVVDHAGGEGVYGEMFYAALETLALADDYEGLTGLIRKALTFIPEVSRVYKAVKDTCDWFEQGVSYTEIRNLILEKHGRANFTDAPQNLAFSMVGLLYGKDFEDGLLKTVNLGYDTDCTVATLGALYGLLYGTSFIPAKWSDPIGDKVVVSAAILGCDAPKDNDELTDRCMRMIDILNLSDKSFCKVTAEEALDVHRQRFIIGGGTAPHKNLTATVRYVDGVSAVPGCKKHVRIDFLNSSDGIFNMRMGFKGEYTECISVSDDFLSLKPGDSKTLDLELSVKDSIPASFKNALVLERLHGGEYWCTYEVNFTLLRAKKWEIEGKTSFVEGTLISFDAPNTTGIYSASCRIFVPSGRKMKVMAACTSPILLEMDGEMLFSDREHRDFMPAFHRCPASQSYTGPVREGIHNIKITVTEKDYLPSFIFNMVEPEDVGEPGNHSAYVDCEIGV